MPYVKFIQNWLTPSKPTWRYTWVLAWILKWIVGWRMFFWRCLPKSNICKKEYDINTGCYNWFWSSWIINVGCEISSIDKERHIFNLIAIWRYMIYFYVILKPTGYIKFCVNLDITQKYKWYSLHMRKMNYLLEFQLMWQA